MVTEAEKESRVLGLDIVLHGRAERRSDLPVGTFARTLDGTIVGYEGGSGLIFRSNDEGVTWEKHELGVSGVKLADTAALLCTRDGTLVLASGNLAMRHWTPWDKSISGMPGARLPTVVMRSQDGGLTWQDVQTLHTEWTGANRDMIQIKSGRLVFTSMKLLTNPGRHGVLTYASDDDGRSWQASNLIDLGGCGDHDGVMEATLIELKDGRLMKYIRTNWGYFWRAESTDGGDHWHPYGPSPVATSTAPGMLTRLESGAILLVYNQPQAEDGSAVKPRDGDRKWAATPASTFREELSVRVSDDEGETWTHPVVIASREKEGEVCYPHVFEVSPGRLWITAHRFGLRMEINEEDCLPR